jgi:hypothetical protein
MANGTVKWFSDQKGFVLNRETHRMCLFIIQQSTQAVLNPSMRATKFPFT